MEKVKKRNCLLDSRSLRQGLASSTARPFAGLQQMLNDFFGRVPFLGHDHGLPWLRSSLSFTLTESARTGQISLSKFKVRQYTGRTTLVAAHLLEPAIQREATQAEVFGSQ